MWGVGGQPNPSEAGSGPCNVAKAVGRTGQSDESSRRNTGAAVDPARAVGSSPRVDGAIVMKYVSARHPRTTRPCLNRPNLRYPSEHIGAPHSCVSAGPPRRHALRRKRKRVRLAHGEGSNAQPPERSSGAQVGARPLRIEGDAPGAPSRQRILVALDYLGLSKRLIVPMLVPGVHQLHV